MKKNYIAVLVAALLVFSGTAFAATVSGKYAGTKNNGQSIWIETQTTDGATTETKEIWVTPETTWEGVSTVTDLGNGQDLVVEAVEDVPTGGWKATSVKAAAPAAMAAMTTAAPAAAAPAAPASN